MGVWQSALTLFAVFILIGSLSADSLPLYGFKARETKLTKLIYILNLALSNLDNGLDYFQPFILSGQAPVVDVSVGSPAQKFLVRLDLFSAEFWIVDDECASEACMAYKRRLFNKMASLSYNQTDFETGEIDYFGNIGKDVLQIGDASATIHFPLAFELNKYFKNIPYDGILGVAGPSLSDIDQKLNIETPLQAFNGVFDENVFVITYDKNPSGTSGPSNGQDLWSRVGEVTFGSKSTSSCSNDWNFINTKISSNLADAHQFMLEGFYVGDVLENRRKRDAWFFVLFPYTLAPKRNVETIAEKIGAELNVDLGVYTVQCSTISSLPEIRLRLKGFTVSIAAEEYIDSSDAIQEELENGKCLLTIIPAEQTFWQIGTRFLESNCVAFDYGNNKIGFAKKT